MTEYSPEIKKKIGSFLNAIARKEMNFSLQGELKGHLKQCMTPENQVILSNLMADFDNEVKLCEMFRSWLLQKTITQTEIFPS